MTSNPQALRSPTAALAAELWGLIGLATPIVVGLLAGTAFSAIDSYMLAPVGGLALAAASLTNSVLIVFYSAVLGLSGPVAILTAQAYGADDAQEIGSLRSHAIVVAAIGGLLAAIAMIALLPALQVIGQPPEVVATLPSYWLAMSLSLVPFSMAMAVKQLLDSINQPWISALLTLLPVTVIVPLNWLLIYGNWGFPALGLAGAGVATLTSQAFGYAVMHLYVSLSRGMTKYARAPKIEREKLWQILRNGLPMSLQYLAESSAVAFVGLLIGFLGASALAANQIAFSLGALIYMIPLGVSGAVGIRIARAVGEGTYERVRVIGMASFTAVVVLMLPFTMAGAMCGESIARVFVDDEKMVSLVSSLFVTIGLMLIFDGLQSVALGALRGLLDNRWPTCVALVTYWLLALPLSALFGLAAGYGPAGVWAGFGVGVAVAAALLINRFKSLTTRVVVPAVEAGTRAR